MKKILIFYFLMGLFSLVLVLFFCIKDICEAIIIFQAYELVYMKFVDFCYVIEFEVFRDLENFGKIYIYQDILFINEWGVGIYLIDNSNLEVF